MSGEKEKVMIQVKLFDTEHEQDLEEEMNQFLEELEERQLLDIKYNVAALPEDEEDQIYCFSAMVIYRA
jgi:Sporulation protein Cse60